MHHNIATLVGNTHSTYHLKRLAHLRRAQGLGVEAIQTYTVPVLRGIIQTLVIQRINHILDTCGIVSRERSDLAGGGVHHIEMIVIHARCCALGHSLANTAESLCACHKEHLVAIASIDGIAYKSVLLYQHFALHGLQVEVVECLTCCWSLRERVGGYREEDMSAIGSDVAYRNGMVSICKWLHHSRCKVKTCQRISRAPPRLTVVGMHNLKYTVFLLRSIMRLHYDGECLGG